MGTSEASPGWWEVGEEAKEMETWRDRPRAANVSREPELSCLSSPRAPSRAITHKRSKEERPGYEEQFLYGLKDGASPVGPIWGTSAQPPTPPTPPPGIMMPDDRDVGLVTQDP